MTLTGKRDLREFWKLSPAELVEWCAAATDDEDNGIAEEIYGDLEMGEEVID